MAKRIIVDSIKDHLIPQVSFLKTPKAMFDALNKLFEGKNINRKMTLRNQLKNVKIQNEETIQSYFKRVSQIKEQLEVVDEEVENAEIMMTTLNGIPRSWNLSFKVFLLEESSHLQQTMGGIFTRRSSNSSPRRKYGK